LRKAAAKKKKETFVDAEAEEGKTKSKLASASSSAALPSSSSSSTMNKKDIAPKSKSEAKSKSASSSSSSSSLSTNKTDSDNTSGHIPPPVVMDSSTQRFGDVRRALETMLVPRQVAYGDHEVQWVYVTLGFPPGFGFPLSTQSVQEGGGGGGLPTVSKHTKPVEPVEVRIYLELFVQIGYGVLRDTHLLVELPDKKKSNKALRTEITSALQRLTYKDGSKNIVKVDSENVTLAWSNQDSATSDKEALNESCVALLSVLYRLCALGTPCSINVSSTKALLPAARDFGGTLLSALRLHALLPMLTSSSLPRPPHDPMGDC
jgi:hypothetical protein